MSLHFKRLGVLLLSLFGLVSFCSATSVSDKIDIIGSGSIDYMTGKQIYSILDIGTDYGTYCVNFLDYQTNGGNPTLKMGFADSTTGTPTNLYTLYKNQTGNYICLYGNKRYFNIYIDSTAYHGTSQYEIFKLNTLLIADITCPSQYTSQECQIEYSLIPVSSVDSNYCTTNGFCPSSGGGDCLTGDTNWSALYINDIQHLGKPIISIDIPEEIDWDYTSTDSEFNVSINGYNVDYDYINDIVSVQNYKPTQEDFNNIIGSFGSFGSLLIGALFIILLFYFIKKIFK